MIVKMVEHRFAWMVRHRKKRTTIRPLPKRMPKPGQIISLREWKGKAYRSGQRVLLEAPIEFFTEVKVTRRWGLQIGLSICTPGMAQGFAEGEGFSCMAELVDWIREAYGLPFKGIMFFWK